ncbi:uncharacterized protein E0L32_008982 [Thyridium curvatum]|uniref:WW domain-containing protein n=1 Tax=Thyridium curvatum TaxID=1093900 RepID=A0A507AXY7_9PEZI|nr:uncharacterized protein E0L32_008982 [Thyridium curvatum]TPX09791.1 hypothetical protein E0L32_008982 [Thyridium curvatum]
MSSPAASKSSAAEVAEGSDQPGNGTPPLSSPGGTGTSPAADTTTNRSRSNSPAGSETGSVESGELDSAPPLPQEPAPDAAPPLPQEPAPGSAADPSDDGWDCHWDATHNAWFFFNRFTHQTQWDNPRVPSAAAAAPAAAPGTDAATEPLAPPPGSAPVGGYNPAIHGDYDPNAWYAQGYQQPEDGGPKEPLPDPGLLYVSGGFFNRHTGKFQTADQGPSRHSDDAKSNRQMNAYFDVDAAANAHNGRSLKAERSGKKPSKSELKAFKEKRRAKKEEKRRAWLRD